MTGVLRVQGVGLLLVLVVTCVAGCDGEKGGTWPTGPGSTVVTRTQPGSSPSPSATTVDPPKLPDAATKPTRAGAEAFFRYFWDVYNYSYSSLSSRELRRISSKRCSSCEKVAQKIDDARRKGRRFEGGWVTIRNATALRGAVKDGLLIKSVIDQSASRILTGSGVVDTSPPRWNRRLDAAVVWTGGRWYMLALGVTDKVDS